jgi:hypothetical protein
LSAYQWMGLLAIPYSWLLPACFAPRPQLRPDLPLGLHSLWSPSILLGLQLLWLFILFYTGRSTVTGATLTFHINHEQT